MIISASRRTDIPAYYADWFFNRLREGFTLVRNPFNRRMISKVLLAPERVDCFVFWTRNPHAFLSRMAELRDYNYYFQFTLTPYARNVEPNLPSKPELIGNFRRLSELIGPERVIWRYDPIIITPQYTVEYHLQSFAELCAEIAGHTRKCVFSFYDDYKFAARNSSCLNLLPITIEIVEKLAGGLAAIAKRNNLVLETCAEAFDLAKFGINHGKCIDDQLISLISHRQIVAEKDKNQRLDCGCIKSVDIGTYSTCLSGCRYCYATRSHEAAILNASRHDPASPLLIGEVEQDCCVSLRSK